MALYERPALFARRGRKLTMLLLTGTAAMSVLAFGVLAADNGVSWAGHYSAVSAGAKNSHVSGTLTNGVNPLSKGSVTLVYRNANGNIIKTVTKQLRKGAFRIDAPRRAASVRVNAYRGSGERVSRRFRLRSGKNIHVTAAIPKRGRGILPMIFSY